MLRRSAQRLGITLCVVLSLLFSQLALASYVCSSVPSGSGDPAAMSMAMDMAPGQPCDDVDGTQPDARQPVLCHQHCVNAPQSFDPVQLPTASLPAVVHVHLVPLLLDTGSVAASADVDVDRARPPPDPLFLSTLRLRV